MTPHPFRSVAVAGVHNTVQARQLPDHDSTSIALAGALGALADAGIAPHEVDGVVGPACAEIALEFGLGPAPGARARLGIPTFLDAAALITTGQCAVVVVAAGGAGIHTDGTSRRPGLGRRTSSSWVTASSRRPNSPSWPAVTCSPTAPPPNRWRPRRRTIRNNGHVNPDAVYHARGRSPPRHPASRMIADPFHLLDCAMTRRGAAGSCCRAPTGRPNAGHRVDPRWGQRRLRSRLHGCPGVGPPAPYRRRRRRDGRAPWRPSRRSRRPGSPPAEVDVAELYDPFSFEIIRQLEAFGFCPVGEGGPFVADGNIAPWRRLPVTTDGGTMSFSHPGISAQQLQRVIRAVQQLRGTCADQSGRGSGGRPLLERGLGRPVLRRPAARAESAHEPPASPAGGHPGARTRACTASPTGKDVAGTRLLYQQCAECGYRRARRLHRLRAVPRDVTRLGGQRRPRLPLQLDSGVAAAQPAVSTCPTPLPSSAWTKDSG